MCVHTYVCESMCVYVCVLACACDSQRNASFSKVLLNNSVNFVFRYSYYHSFIMLARIVGNCIIIISTRFVSNGVCENAPLGPEEVVGQQDPCTEVVQLWSGDKY